MTSSNGRSRTSLGKLGGVTKGGSPQPVSLRRAAERMAKAAGHPDWTDAIEEAFSQQIIKLDSRLVELEIRKGLRTERPVRKRGASVVEQAAEILAEPPIRKRDSWEGML